MKDLQWYKNPQDAVYAIEAEFAHMLPANCVLISGEEAETLRASRRALLQESVIIVSAWQIRKALNQLALRDAVEQAVAQADQDTRDAWQYAKEFERTHPLVISLGISLGKSEAELDDVFALAKSK